MTLYESAIKHIRTMAAKDKLAGVGQGAIKKTEGKYYCKGTECLLIGLSLGDEVLGCGYAKEEPQWRRG